METRVAQGKALLSRLGKTEGAALRATRPRVADPWDPEPGHCALFIPTLQERYMINIPKGTKDVLPADSYKW